jgi:hypothetical protein
LQGATELQNIGVGIGQHIGRHRHRQQQGPFESAPAGKLEQGHSRRGPAAEQGHARGDKGGQEQRLQGVAGQHGLGLVYEHSPGRCVESEPCAEHTQHRQGEQQADQGQQDAHCDEVLQMRTIRIQIS